MTDRPVVSVVDDDASVRRSLARLIQSAGFSVETFSSAQAFLAEDHSRDPACLVLDIQMPGVSGLDLQEDLLGAGLDVPIVFITGHGSVPQTVQAMRAGAVDFIEKPFSEEQLLRAVRQAIDRHDESAKRREETESVNQRLASLTQRERQVLALVITGMLNKQIAAELGTTEKTIKVHRSRVMRKMRAASVVDLVRFAEKAGIGQPHST
jgi:RNA polymerase sigma factor (sigma-70 family)